MPEVEPMMTRSLVALLAAAAFAAQAALLHAVVAAPLATAIGELNESARPAFEETITVVAAPAPAAPASRS
jgi:hypothetical protein